MQHALNPFRFVVTAVAGWMNQQQQHAIDYLREENRVLREQLGGRRLRFTDDQRRRFAAKASWSAVEYWMTLPTLLHLIHYWPGTADSLHRSMMAMLGEDPDDHA